MAWIVPAIQIGGMLLSAYMQHQQQSKDGKNTSGFNDFLSDVNTARARHGLSSQSTIGFNDGGGSFQNQAGNLNFNTPSGATSATGNAAFNAPSGAGTGNTGLSQAALQYFQNMRNQPASGTLANSPYAFSVNPYLQQRGNTSFSSLAQQNNNLPSPGYNPGLQQLNQRRY